jgi:sec1 family domain-containing protein 1
VALIRESMTFYVHLSDVDLDPKKPGSKPPKGKVTFQDAIVFVVGGGNYLEYQNLKEYAYRSNLVKKQVMYGSTELLTAKKFMNQLELLGGKR